MGRIIAFRYMKGAWKCELELLEEADLRFTCGLFPLLSINFSRPEKFRLILNRWLTSLRV
ncbi:MAG TPA: hypothetical protein DCS60_07585 [Opitutae bacterium]|nr:hypothetical protein [Opitutae bacterium]